MDKEMLSGQFLEQSIPDGEGMGRKDQYLLRQRTAVVGALSNIFSDMYYIDLEENTIQIFWKSI